jgi:hypothetical protein
VNISEFSLMHGNVRVQVFVADFGERQRPVGHDAHAGIRRPDTPKHRYEIDSEEINEYLAGLTRDPRSPSRSSFKHMVYGLRYYYRLLGMNKNAIALLSLKLG